MACAVLASGMALAGCGSEPTTVATAPAPATPAQQAASFALSGAPDVDRSLRSFSVHMVDEMQAYWRKALAGTRFPYRPLNLAVTEEGADTECGFISQAAYCPEDRTMVVALPFLRDELVGGDDTGRNDGAVTAVLAHEFGHHLQVVTGIDRRLLRIEERSPDTANAISVVRELHADCLAGTWMSIVAKNRTVTDADLDETLGMLSRLGEDNLSRSLGKDTDWTAYTHGTAWLREKWFIEGFQRKPGRGCSAVMRDFYEGIVVAGLMRDLARTTDG